MFQGFVSFLLPCFAVDHLYLSYDEYLFSEEETPIAEGNYILYNSKAAAGALHNLIMFILLL